MEDRDLKVRRVDWYFDEWLAGTAMLNAVERGVYVTICNMVYSRGGPIDSEGLSKLCGCHGHAFKRALNRLQTLGKIIANDSQITVKRCAKELQRARIRLANARENGDKGGRPRSKNNNIEKPTGCFSEKLAGASFNLQLPTTNHQPVEKPAQRRGTRLPADFVVPQDWQEEGAKARMEAGLPAINIEVQAAQFVDFWHAKAGRDGAKLDWLATWRNWCRNARVDNGSRTNGSTTRRLDDAGLYDGPTEPAPTIEGFEFPMDKPH